MPIHEYRCETCGHVIEVLEPLEPHEKPPEKCQRVVWKGIESNVYCKGEMKRIVSAGAFKIK